MPDEIHDRDVIIARQIHDMLRSGRIAIKHDRGEFAEELVGMVGKLSLINDLLQSRLAKKVEKSQ